MIEVLEHAKIAAVDGAGAQCADKAVVHPLRFTVDYLIMPDNGATTRR
jgi:hypothetical protein